MKIPSFVRGRGALSVTLIVTALLVPSVARADLNIVATVPDLAAMAREIGGNHVKVTSLALPSQDPHFVDAKPSMVLRVNKADLLLAVGASLEIGWLPALQRGARNSRILTNSRGYLACANHVNLLDTNRRVSRSEGDIHPGGNPHYLYDPRRAKMCVHAITKRMASLDSSNAAAYRKRGAKLERKIDAVDRVWRKRLAAYRGTAVLTYHRSWTYLNDWLGLREVANLEPKPGVPPSPGHIVKVIRLARASKVKVLFQETFYPDRVGALVARKVGATEVQLPGGTNFRGGETYIQHMMRLLQKLQHALQGHRP